MANPDAPPLFIVGAPRSGTSLVYRLLALHPQASWVNNYLRRAPAMPVLSALNRVARATPKLRASVWFGSDGDNAYRYGGARSVLERLYPQPTEGEPLFAHHGVPEAWGGEQVTERQRGLVPALSRVARWSGGPTLVSKRIGHNRRIDLLHELDPAARFLSVTRDGRAVAHSLLKVDWWPQMQIWWFDDRLPADWAAEGRDPLELCARHWVREVETMRGRPRRGARRAGDAHPLRAAHRRPDGGAVAGRHLLRTRSPRPFLARGPVRRAFSQQEHHLVGVAQRVRAADSDTARRSAARDGLPRWPARPSSSAPGAAGRRSCTRPGRPPRDTGFVTNLDDSACSRSSVGRSSCGAGCLPGVTEKGRVRFAPSEGYRALGREVWPEPRRPGMPTWRPRRTPWLRKRLTSFVDGPHPTASGRRSSCTSSPAGRGRAAAAPSPTRASSQIVRDGRAVANSWLQMDWWHGHLGPAGGTSARCPPTSTPPGKVRGAPSPSLPAWPGGTLTEAHDACAEALGDRWITVRYEDVLRDHRPSSPGCSSTSG